MRASISTSSLASLAIILVRQSNLSPSTTNLGYNLTPPQSTMTIATVHAIPAAELLATSSSIEAPIIPSDTISVPAPAETVNNIDSSIKDVAAWEVGCVDHDPTQLGHLTPANTESILDGVLYLQKTPGQPFAKEHPICGQVSCSYNSAIWWCNEDTTQSVTVHGGYKVLAEGAQAIVNQCDKGEGRVMGKAATHWGQWTGQKVNVSVIVTGGVC
ncbi:hypothetical protein B0T20DRAFT_440153 [Sordaria brevicollis]|uniref:Uncharacterized protein n=1 Tax=Sordaria brevicollis TaxID=83679 RepID=A0AAE0PBI7_SORBR|nr:hypothetical protein B0T20DRAFT_440153 [Sordaria brevicollis]